MIVNNEILLKIYSYVKKEVIKKGFEKEINWYDNIPSLDQISKWFFFREYCWVVLNSGMKNSVAEKIFDTFWNNGDFNFEAIKHPNKNKSIKEVYAKLDRYFTNVKNSKNILKYLETLPHIGPITKFHLAKNLGFNCGKPDRHLERITSFFECSSVQDFCKDVSEISNDKISVVDVVFWRFATLFDNYIEIFQELINKK